VRALLEQHRRTMAPITCPLIGQQRGNPVLFDRSTFSDFFTLEGDSGARQIFSRYPLDYLPWHDQSLLMDVDTPADYDRLTRG
jgi:molybdenum cofactor cytidylyltransferase